MKNIIARLIGIGTTLWEFVRPLVFGATAQALEEVLPHAEDVVESLADSQISGEEKRSQAVASLRAILVSAGIAASTAILNLAVEMAVAKLKSK